MMFTGNISFYLTANLEFGRFQIKYSTFAILLAATLISFISWAGGSILVQPDSGNYIAGGVILSDGGDFFHNIGLNRVPGYHTLIGVALSLSERYGFELLVIFQHALWVCGVVIVKKIGDILDHSGVLGLAAGLIAVFSFQILAYTNMIMSEVVNAFIVTFGVYFATLHMDKGDRRSFLWGVTLFSLAAMFRPAGKLLPYMLMTIPVLRMVLPNWRLLTPQIASDRIYNLKLVLLGCVINAVIVMPWAIFNWKENDYFGLTGTLGLNLYSNTVEFGGFMDEDSPAMDEIHAVWGDYLKLKAEKGQIVDPDKWRQHMAILGAFLTTTDKNIAQADEVLMRAAVDAIKLHPYKYLRHVFKGVVEDAVYYDPAYLYLPGVSEENPDPTSPFQSAMSLERLEQIRKNTNEMIQNMNKNDAIIVFSEPGFFTTPYGYLSKAYQKVFIHGTAIGGLFFLGGLLSIVIIFRKKKLAWVVPLAFVASTLLIAGAVVPSSPRHRLATDLVISLYFALPLIFFVRFIYLGATKNNLNHGVLLNFLRGREFPVIGELNRETISQIQRYALMGLIAYIIAATLYMGGKTWTLALILSLLILIL